MRVPAVWTHKWHASECQTAFRLYNKFHPYYTAGVITQRYVHRLQMHGQKNMRKTNYFRFTQTDTDTTFICNSEKFKMKGLTQCGVTSIHLHALKMWDVFIRLCVFFKDQKNVGLLCVYVRSHTSGDKLGVDTQTHREVKGQTTTFLTALDTHTHLTCFFQHGGHKRV